MDEKTFHEEVAKVLLIEPHQVSDDLVLDEQNWDSLAQVSMLLVVDEASGRKIESGEIAGCKTVGDLKRLAGL